MSCKDGVMFEQNLEGFPYTGLQRLCYDVF